MLYSVRMVLWEEKQQVIQIKNNRFSLLPCGSDNFLILVESLRKLSLNNYYISFCHAIGDSIAVLETINELNTSLTKGRQETEIRHWFLIGK